MEHNTNNDKGLLGKLGVKNWMLLREEEQEEREGEV